MQRKKLGITGGNGVIGSILCGALKDDYHVVIFDAKSSIDAKDRVDEVIVDFSKEISVKGIFDGLDIVIHLAANPSVKAVRCQLAILKTIQ
jgi:nucleoside-diphosphate-sugar epimerase